MKKYTLLCTALAAAMLFTGCKSSESAYKQAYLKAKQQEEAQQQQQATAQETTNAQNVVVPMQEKAANNTQVVDNADNVAVRQESVSVVSGAGLKNFSVVVGSFGLLTNAEGLQQQLRDGGYNAQIVKNESNNMFRVVAATFDNKSDAVNSRNAIRGTQFNEKGDAWLLYNMQ